MTTLRELFSRHWLLTVWFPVLAFICLSLLSLKLESWYPVLVVPVVFAVYLVFFRTHAAYQFLLFLIPLSIPITDVGGGLGMSLPAEPFIWLFFVGIVLHIASGARTDIRIGLHPIVVAIAIYVLWTLASSVTSVMPFVSLKYSLSTLWFLAAFLVIPLHLFQKTEFIHTYLKWLITGTLILVLYTLYKHSGGGFSRPYAHTAMRPFLPDHGVYAALLAMFIPYGWIAFFKGEHFGMGWPLRIFLAFASTVLFIGVVFSFTRASWISLAVAAIAMGLLFFRVRLWMVLSVLFSTLAVIVFFWGDITNELSRNTQGSDDDFVKHLSSVYNISTDPSNLERLNRWDCAIHMFEERPLMGWGPGTYTFQYAPFQKSYNLTLISTHAGDVGNAHSEFMRPLAESGLPAFISFTAIVFLTIAYAWSSYLKTNNDQYRYLLLAVVGGLSTYFFHSLVNNYTEYDKIAAPFWGMIAAVVVLSIKVRREGAK
jgi:putative inorganic carbon (HCO3(-)) transporter